MELDPESIRTLNRLPPHAKHCLRYRASQLTVMREVEMRLSPPDPPEKTLDIFQAEGRELSLLDSPWFLPVLEAGTFQDRPFYLVPLRRHPTLGEALEDPRFGAQERFWAVRHLAGMMAALHDVHGALGPPYLDLLAWSWSENQLVCLHHKHLPRTQPTWLRGKLPEDMQSGSKWSARTDLFLWGCFAYWLLTDGRAPYPFAADELVTIRRLRPGLAGDLAEAIEACLAWDLVDRPRDAVELRSALQQSPSNERTPPSDGAELDEPGFDPGRHSSMTFRARIDELREAGLVPDAGEASLVESFVAVGRLTASRLGEVPTSRAGPWLVAGVLAIVVLVLGSTLAPYLRPPPPAIVLGPATPRPSRPPPAIGKVLLAPSRQASLLREPLVQSLVALPAVTPESFDDCWTVLRKVVLADKLPPGLIDGATLVELRRLEAVDPERAVAELAARIDAIRRALDAS